MGEWAGVALARAMAALADADLFAQDAHPIDGTRPTVAAPACCSESPAPTG